MKSILIVTTNNDKSLELLQDACRVAALKPSILLYEDHLTQCVTAAYDVVYFRDPFNTLKYSTKAISSHVANVSNKNPNAYYIDNCRNFNDLQFEDKWSQYRELKEFMPETTLVNTPEEFIADDEFVYKERVSSRARGIYFNQLPVFKKDTFIKQKLFEVEVDYRVFGGNSLPSYYAVARRPKTKDTHIKVIGNVELPSGVKAVVDEVRRHPSVKDYDLFGMDVIRTTDGEIKIIEVNRSPQFAGLKRVSSINIAEQLIGNIAKKL